MTASPASRSFGSENTAVIVIASFSMIDAPYATARAASSRRDSHVGRVQALVSQGRVNSRLPLQVTHGEVIGTVHHRREGIRWGGRARTLVLYAACNSAEKSLRISTFGVFGIGGRSAAAAAASTVSASQDSIVLTGRSRPIPATMLASRIISIVGILSAPYVGLVRAWGRGMAGVFRVR